jgi:hypothetical protein
MDVLYWLLLSCLALCVVAPPRPCNCFGPEGADAAHGEGAFNWWSNSNSKSKNKARGAMPTDEKTTQAVHGLLADSAERDGAPCGKGIPPVYPCRRIDHLSGTQRICRQRWKRRGRTLPLIAHGWMFWKPQPRSVHGCSPCLPAVVGPPTATQRPPGVVAQTHTPHPSTFSRTLATPKAHACIHRHRYSTD